MSRRLTLTVVIPTRNESQQMPSLRHSLQQQTEIADQIIIADAGSTDDTLAVASEFGFEIAHCPKPGRGCQIAFALRQVQAKLVVVLHADTRLEPMSLAAIRSYMESTPDCPGGCLGHRFDRRSVLLRMVEWGDYFRAAWLGKSFGDQVQFFRRAIIESAGGFPDQPIMEDIELAHLLRKLGKPAYLGMPATTSARRFDRLGVWTTINQNARLRREYSRRGKAAAEELFREYYGA